MKYQKIVYAAASVLALLAVTGTGDAARYDVTTPSSDDVQTGLTLDEVKSSFGGDIVDIDEAEYNETLKQWKPENKDADDAKQNTDTAETSVDAGNAGVDTGADPESQPNTGDGAAAGTGSGTANETGTGDAATAGSENKDAA